MKMRKILSFVLVLTLVLGSFSMAFAATPADVVGTPNEEAVTVLMGLGVINGYEDGSYKPENIVTRAEMAKLVVVALGLEDYAKVGTSSYPDMVGAGWAQGYVGYATSLGIIEGYPDGTFKPSATVSYPEAATMIVRALGYTDASLLPATWPANFVVKAKALGIFDDVTTSAIGANRGDIAQMLFNALTVNMVTVDSDNKITVTVPEDNMLLRLGATEEDSAVIYGTEDSNINLVRYIGTNAVAYTVDDKIVAVDVDSDSITGNFEPSSTTLTTGAGIVNASTSDDTDYNVNATIAGKSVAYFWNGVEEPTSTRHPKYSIDTMSTATGPNTIAVDLSGKRIDDVYAISYWNVSASDVFTADDADSITDDQSLFDQDFILDDNDDIDLNQFIIEGAATLADIDVDDVVYVYNGWHEAGVKKVAVGTEVITGKVTEKDASSWLDGTTVMDDSDYTIGGKVYNLAYAVVADGHGGIAKIDSPEVGDTITARLDAYGNIFDFEVDSSTPDMYGMVIGTDFDNTIDNDRVKLYTSADATKTFEVDSDVDAADLGIANDDLIGYALDKDGVIDAIDTDADDAATAYLVSAKVLNADGMTYAVDSDVVVFTYDAEGDYDVTTIANVDTGSDTELVGFMGLQFITDEDGYVVAMVIDAEAAGVTTDDTYAVVNRVVTAIDADDEAVQKVTGFANGAAFSKYTDDADDITLDTATITLWNVEVDADGIATAFTQVDNSEVYSATMAALSADKTAVQIFDTWYAIADTATVYVVEMVDGDYEYSLSTLSALRDTYTISLYETDDDEDGYDIVIFEK